MQNQINGKQLCKLPMRFAGLLIASIALAFCSCSKKITETGKASYYADKFVGRPTASGQVFSQRKKTAAHPSLPFGTRVLVVNNNNGKRVKVTINDRGPFVAGRIIDLTKKAAKKLDMVQSGVVPVTIKYKKPR
jgi:rare lipoprotein A